MSDGRPEPLVPADVDLRDFPFMPLDVLRLRDSELTMTAIPGSGNPVVPRVAPAAGSQSARR